MQQYRLVLLGGLGLLAGLCALVIVTVSFWPDVPFIGTVGRMLDSMPLHLLGLLLGLLGVLAALGCGRFVSWVCIFVLLGVGGTVWQHLRLSAPLQPEVPHALNILWYNVLFTNTLPADTLIDALVASPADVILLTEAAPLRHKRARLEEHFAQVSGCNDRACSILMLSRTPHIRPRFVTMPSTSTQRMGVFEIDIADHAPLSLIGVHMVKPWYYGFRHSDEWLFTGQLRRLSGPVVVVGDFNAAPWSRPVRHLTTICGLSPLRLPPSTWPARLERWGIPIDLVLTRSGAVVRKVTPWGGQELGSNHRGLLVDVGVRHAPQEQVNAPCRLKAKRQ